MRDVLARPGRLAVAILLALAIGACASEASAQTTYDLSVRATPGEKWTFENSQALRQKYTMTAPDGERQQIEQTLTIRRKGTAEVLAASAGKATAMRITFDPTCGGVVKADGQEQEIPFPLKNRSVTIRRTAEGELTHDHSGALEPGVVQELARMLDGDQSFLPPGPVAVGARWTPDREKVAGSFQMEDSAGISGECALNDVRPVGGRQAAEVALTVRFDRAASGGMTCTGKIDGVILVDLATGRLLEADAHGSLQIAGNQVVPGPHGRMEVQVAGQLELTNRATWKPLGGGPATPGAVALPTPPAGSAAPAPTSEPTAADWSGKYAGERISAELARKPDGGYTGTIIRGEQRFPLEARVVGGRLEGSFTHQGSAFPFTAEREGRALVLKTGTTTYRLTLPPPSAANPLDTPTPVPANPLEKPTGEFRPPRTPSPRGGTLRFVRHSVMDTPQMIGGEAVSLLVPAGWHVESNVVWRHCPASPATMVAVVADRQSPRQVVFLPQQNFAWGDMLANNPHFPVGSNYLGNEVRPPFESAAAALRAVVIPRVRPDVDFRVIEAKSLPAVAQAAEKAAGPKPPTITRMAFDAARVRIAYELAGQAVEEDFYCVLDHSEFSAAGRNIFQQLERVTALRAAAGRLDAATPVLQFIVSSARINLPWFNKLTQVSNHLVQAKIQEIRNTGVISDIISRTHNEISDMIMESYRTRQAADDRMARSFAQTLRGVEEFALPEPGRTIELPSGYAQAFINDRGEYLLSNDLNFDPNAETDQNWRRLNKAEGSRSP
jgi:hypothetical protein